MGFGLWVQNLDCNPYTANHPGAKERGFREGDEEGHLRAPKRRCDDDEDAYDQGHEHDQDLGHDDGDADNDDDDDHHHHHDHDADAMLMLMLLLMICRWCL